MSTVTTLLFPIFRLFVVLRSFLMEGNGTSSLIAIVLRVLVRVVSAVFGLDCCNFLDERREGGRDVDVLFGADLHESPALLTGEFGSHLRSNHFVGLVHFVAHEHDHRILRTVVFNLLRPSLQCQERLFVRDIVNKKSSDRAPIENGRYSFESFLTQGVPNVKLSDLLRAWNHDVFALKLDLGRRDVVLVEGALSVAIGNTRLAHHLVAH